MNSHYYIIRSPEPPANAGVSDRVRAKLRTEASAEHRFIPPGDETARTITVKGVDHAVVERDPEADRAKGGPPAKSRVVAGPLTMAEARQWIAKNADPDEAVVQSGNPAEGRRA